MVKNMVRRFMVSAAMGLALMSAAVPVHAKTMGKTVAAGGTCKVNMQPGDTVYLKVKKGGKKISAGKIGFSSSDYGTVFVGGDGAVYAKSLGNAVVTAVYGGKTAKVTVNVTARHKHAYSAQRIVKPATCTRAAKVRFVCPCGDSYTASVGEKMKHRYTYPRYNAALGATVMMCSECGMEKSVYDSGTCAHDWVVKKAPYASRMKPYYRNGLCFVHETGWSANSVCTKCGAVLKRKINAKYVRGLQ